LNSKVSLIGGGFVGSGWAIVFARAGFLVNVFDADINIRSNFFQRIQENLKKLDEYGLIVDPDIILNNITMFSSMSEAVSGSIYIQESIFEDVSQKKDLMCYLDKLVDPKVIIASSSSGITASQFSKDLEHKDRYLVSHPLNPPYLIPLVEIVPSPWTSLGAINFTYDLMKQIGQEPIKINKEIQGFILNRLQGVLLREAWELYREGYASLDDIDKTVSSGLGMRWSFMGPFETIDLNAPGGIADYASRLGDLYYSISESRKNTQNWDKEIINKVEQERRISLSKEKLEEKQKWRDDYLMKLVQFRLTQEKEG
jgi:3-hydroxyacyl-CoA dehydrogenase